VKNRFQNLPVKFNLQRYSAEALVVRKVQHGRGVTGGVTMRSAA
jgi:hypothetical protein